MNTDSHPNPRRGPLRRLRVPAVAAIVGVVGALTLTPTSPALADTSGDADVVTFGFIGATVQTYDVGQNVASIDVEAAGAGGGYNAITPDMGKSEGALVTGTLSGAACDQLLISVAQGGTPAGGNPNGGSPSSGAGGWGGLGGSWTGGAGAHGSEILGGIGGGAAIEPTGQGGTGGSGDDLGGHGGGGGGGVKGGGGGGGAGGTSTGGGGGAGSSVAALPLEDWGVTISGVNWNNSSGYPNGWVKLTVTMKPVPSMGLAIANTTITEGGSIGSVSATLPTDATGTVDFADVTDPAAPVSLGFASVSEGGAVLAQTTQELQGVGEHTIQASYSGDSTYSTTSVTQTVTVTDPAPTDERAGTSVTATPQGATAGAPLVIEVSVSEVARSAAKVTAGIPEGTVRATIGDRELTRSTLVAGVAELTVTEGALEPGTHTVEIDYTGSSVHRPSSTTVDVTIVSSESEAPATTTTTSAASGTGSAGTSSGTLARTGVEGLPGLLAVAGSLLSAGAVLLVVRMRIRMRDAA